MKARRKTSSAEKAALLRIFEEDGNLYPSKEQRLAIAQQLRMSPRQVQVWFQNQRSKLAKAAGVAGVTRQPMIAPILSTLQPPPPTHAAGHLVAPPAPQQPPALVPYHQAVRAFEAKAQPQRQQHPPCAVMAKEMAGGVTIEDEEDLLNHEHPCPP